MRVRGIQRVRLHAHVAILAKLSCALARARSVRLAALHSGRGTVPYRVEVAIPARASGGRGRGDRRRRTELFSGVRDDRCRRAVSQRAVSAAIPMFSNMSSGQDL